MTTDALLIVPIEPPVAHIADPKVRRTHAAELHGPLGQALYELEAQLGRSITLDHAHNRPRIGGELWPPGLEQREMSFGSSRATQPYRRSLASVTLATHLERAGLRWRVIDPGIQEIAWWRAQLQALRREPPQTLAVCTTFIVCNPWLQLLIATIRELLPATKLILGGYYYAVDIKQFLSLDADVYCVGEGEVRLPQIVATLLQEGDLGRIPGIYFRRADGALHYTGRAEQLDLNALPPVDWSLAGRIEPHLDLATQGAATWVETQRGCPFKCEFCDYRTIQLPNALDVQAAVQAILGAAVSPQGSVRLTDSTATFPHPRWKAIMQGLIARGGSPVPLWCFGRVADISEEAVEIMAQAGVRHVFIGQESGDQRILQAMKKGTQVGQVRPAVAALGKYGIHATFGFIHGFPGEDEASLRATRHMLLTLNDGFERRPVVLQYLINPLIVYELSTVRERSEMQGADHFMGYDAARFSPKRACEESLETIIAAGRVPHAPIFQLMPGTYIGHWEEFFWYSPHRFELFDWMKAIERGIGIFLERDLEGKQPDPRELARVKERILSRYDRVSALRAARARAFATLQQRLFARLVKEWRAESEGEVGAATRLLLAAAILKDTGSLQQAVRTLRSGRYADGIAAAAAPAAPPAEQQNLVQLSDVFRKETMGAEQQKRRVREARAIAHGNR